MIGRGGYKIKEIREVLIELLCRVILIKINLVVLIVVVIEMIKMY